MPKTYGDISYGLVVGDGQAVRLKADGSGFEAYTPGSGGSTEEELKTASFTASVGGKYAVDSTSGAIVITDPATPGENDEFTVTFVGAASANTITIGGAPLYDAGYNRWYFVRKYYGGAWSTKQYAPYSAPYMASQHFVWENEQDFISGGQVGLQWRNSSYNNQALRNMTVSWFGIPPIGSDARVSVRKGVNDSVSTQSDVAIQSIGWGSGANYVTVFPFASSITRQKSGSQISIKFSESDAAKFVMGCYYKLSGFGGTGYNDVFQAQGTMAGGYVGFNAGSDIGTETETADTAGTAQFHSAYCSFDAKSVAQGEQVVPYVTYPSAFTYGGRGLSVDLEMAIS